MLTRLGRELSQTEGAHYEGGPAVLVPCYYSLQCRLAGRPPSCMLCSEVGGGAIAARLTMCTGTGKVWAKVSRSAEYRAQLPPAQHKQYRYYCKRESQERRSIQGTNAYGKPKSEPRTGNSGSQPILRHADPMLGFATDTTLSIRD
jgi:hypothetical protein